MCADPPLERVHCPQSVAIGDDWESLPHRRGSSVAYLGGVQLLVESPDFSGGFCAVRVFRPRHRPASGPLSHGIDGAVGVCDLPAPVG